LYLYRTEDFNFEEFKIFIQDYKYVEINKKLPKINFLALSDGECYLIEKNLPSKIDIDMDNSYNLTYSLDKIMADIRSNKSGLMLFTGIPGTGKSSLIKYLSQENQDKKFCFVANSNLNILSNPSFVEFCMTSLQNSIIVLEDCEKALLTRDLNKGYDISNILNLTDGIYGDVLNIKIIATLNTVDKLDTALLRKGRLICQSDFKKLTIEQGKNLAKKLNKEIEVNEELQLCEIYNTEDNGGKIAISTQKVGFSM
jgi:SpoVK/Ycf46/Vps4 family AAA+-type ATPase